MARHGKSTQTKQNKTKAQTFLHRCFSIHLSPTHISAALLCLDLVKSQNHKHLGSGYQSFWNLEWGEVFQDKMMNFQENLGLGSVTRSLCRGLVSGKLSDITFTFSVSRPRAHTLRASRLSVNSSPVTLFFFWWKICVQCWAGLSCARQASTDFSAREELLLETPFFSMRLGPDEYETGYKSQENEYKYESGGGSC